MSITVSETSMATSTPADQRIRLVIEAEIFQDDEGGPDSLIVTTDELACQPVTPTQLLGMVSDARAQLDHIETLAVRYETAIAPRAVEEPHSWTFTDRETGQERTVTCLEGCDRKHDADTETPTFAPDVYCWNWSDTNARTLLINSSGEPEDLNILNTIISVEPFHKNAARRVPHAVVEVIADEFVEELDPDGLKAVIDTFTVRLAEMRRRHAELIRIRAAHQERQA